MGLGPTTTHGAHMGFCQRYCDDLTYCQTKAIYVNEYMIDIGTGTNFYKVFGAKKVQKNLDSKSKLWATETHLIQPTSI